MNDPAVNMFLAGMVTAGFLAGGLFFARFWVRSRDCLFLAFAAAFWLLALNADAGRARAGTGRAAELGSTCCVSPRSC